MATAGTPGARPSSFWAWVLALYSAAVVVLHRRRQGNLVPFAVMTLLAVAAFSIAISGAFLPWPKTLPGSAPSADELVDQGHAGVRRSTSVSRLPPA